MKAVVVGAGSQGVPACYAFSRLGFEIDIVERRSNNRINAEEKLESLGCEIKNIYSDFNSNIFEGSDVVFSAAPFFVNKSVASCSINAGVRYCDLGGHPQIASSITSLGKEFKIPTFTDLGLAPGLVNILAEELVRRSEEQVTDVKIMVGGLPVNPEGSLNYARTWSIEGLVNEYSGNCEVLEDGKLKVAEALSDIEEVEFEGMSRLEAFHTKGGLASSFKSLKRKGVINAKYKTIRFYGHVKLIKFLKEECCLNDKALCEAIKNATKETKEDQVLMMAFINGKPYGWKITYDENWTAMQKATAFPAAACAAILAEGHLDSILSPTYEDIPFNKMQDNLNKIGNLPVLL